MGIFSSKTVTTVSASASVNPLSAIESKTSGTIQYAITSSMLNIGYNEYRNLDYKQGSTREVNKAYRVGLQTNSRVAFRAIEGKEVNNPLDDFDDPNTVRNYVGDIDNNLDFMPMLLVKSDDYPEGVIKARDGSKAKQDALKIAKAMNLDLKQVSESILGTPTVPAMGTPEWSKYAKSYRVTGGSSSEASYRGQLVKDTADKKKGMKDVTDVSIGYYGTFSDKTTVAPEALYYTLLACLEHTSIYDSSNPGVPPAQGQPPNPNVTVGTARRFGIQGKLFSSVYYTNGYIHREVTGTVKGNTRSKLGYSKVAVHLDSEEPIVLHKGISLHNDFSASKPPYFDKQGWNTGITGKVNTIPNTYVTIQVQVSPTTYRELVLVDFYQETTIEGNGQVRRSNSGNQSENEKEMTWKEAYIAESFIPLTRSSMMKVSMLRRANLLIECKSYFIQAVNVQKTKKKWYQTGLFKVIVTVIAVVVFVYTGGLAGGILNAVMTIGMGLAINYALNAVIKILVDLGIISNAFAIALVAVVAVYGMAYGMGLKMDFSLSTVTLGTVEATGKVYAAQLVQEQDKFRKDVAELKEENKRLTAATEQLDKDNATDHIGRLTANLQSMLDAVDVPLNETRNQFLGRTTNSNPQVMKLSYDALKTELYIQQKG